jgi:hypothetical protein
MPFTLPVIFGPLTSPVSLVQLDTNFSALANAIGLNATVTYSASMTPDASLGNRQVISATNGTAFTINAPLNPYTGQTLIFTIRNIAGGALGAVTWNAVFKLATWTQPANTFSRSIIFYYDGTNWVEISRTTTDIPN